MSSSPSPIRSESKNYISESSLTYDPIPGTPAPLRVELPNTEAGALHSTSKKKEALLPGGFHSDMLFLHSGNDAVWSSTPDKRLRTSTNTTYYTVAHKCIVIMCILSLFKIQDVYKMSHANEQDKPILWKYYQLPSITVNMIHLYCRPI